MIVSFHPQVRDQAELVTSTSAPESLAKCASHLELVLDSRKGKEDGHPPPPLFLRPLPPGLSKFSTDRLKGTDFCAIVGPWILPLSKTTLLHPKRALV